jgi:hypothetical protein
MRVTHRGLLVSPLFHRLPTRGPCPLRSNARVRSPWKRCNGQPLTCWRGSRRPNRLHTTGWRLTNRQQLVERFTVAELAALARFYSTPGGCRWCARARLYCGRYSDARARGGGLGADYRSGVGALIGAAVGNRAPCRWGRPPAELLARASASPRCRSRRSSGGSSRDRRRDGAIARDRESRHPGREPSAQAPLRPRGRFAPPCLEGLQPAHRSVREVPRPVHNASRFDTSGARTWTSRRP